MAVRATISKGYIWRPGVIGAMMLLFCGWFLYDGTVAYPLQQEIWNTYHQIVQDNPEGDPVEHARLWAEHAKSKGWPTNTPKKKIEDKDILTQKIIAGITAPVGLYFMATFFMARGRWVEADEQGVRTNSGLQTDYQSIKSIDKSRWSRKGIAVVHYGLDGTDKRILLDDWKFEREETKRILAAIEERMPGGGGDEDNAEADEPDGGDSTTDA
jgi:hypothetical protein